MIISTFAIPKENSVHEQFVREQESFEVRQMGLAQRNPAEFSPIYQAYVQRVYAFCLRRSATPQDAEDLCSQVFIRALKGLSSYRGGMVSAWLFQIARNVIANHYRGQKVIISIEDIEIPLADKTSEPIESYQDRQILSDLIKGLSEHKQLLLSLSLDAGLTSAEIGAIVGKKPEAVRVELHRVIKQLRQQYFYRIGRT
jgi:RNA polymerase sigma-70 factor (ECF subfamily)